jgi:hypothetical protein
VEVIVHEDQLASVARNGVLVHAGVTSCVTITAVLAQEIVGLHVVQWAGIPPHDTSYVQRMPALITRFNNRVHGRPIQHLILVAPFDLFPEDFVHQVRLMIAGGIAAGNFHVVDITEISNVGNDVYVMGYADMVQVVREGVRNYSAGFNAIGLAVVAG